MFGVNFAGKKILARGKSRFGSGDRFSDAATAAE
jgi:hypothetical protein